ncbi:MAG: MFS transporter [Nanoarchaeota archaeon]|nr:MFS transporter [Nanoarchaeota archaeon]
MRFNETSKLALMNFLLHLAFLSPVITFFFREKGLNYFQILSLESILMLFILFFELPTGIIGDIIGRKWAILIGGVFIALEPVIFLFSSNFLLFALSFGLAGIGISFLSGTVEAHIYDTLKKKRAENAMKKAMGTYGAAALLAMIIAPAIGSYLAKELIMPQFNILIILTIFANALGVIIILFLKEKKNKQSNKHSHKMLLKSSFNTIRNNNNLKRIILLSIFSSPFMFTLNYLYQPYFKTSGVNISLFGIIFGVSLLLAAVIQKYAYKLEEKIGMKKSIFIATIAPGILYVIMAISISPFGAILLFILLRGLMGLSEPLFADYKNAHIPSNCRATVLSMISMFASVYLLIMRLIIGKLADINLSYAFILIGTIIVLSSFVFRLNESHITIKKINIKKSS